MGRTLRNVWNTIRSTSSTAIYAEEPDVEELCLLASCLFQVVPFVAEPIRVTSTDAIDRLPCQRFPAEECAEAPGC